MLLAGAKAPTRAAGGLPSLPGLMTMHYCPYSCMRSARTTPCHPAATTARRRGPTVAASSTAGSAAAAPTTAAAAVNQLPCTPTAMVDQAAAACQAALDAGSLRQTVVFLLPVNEKEANFTNTEPMDYPCSLQKVAVQRCFGMDVSCPGRAPSSLPTPPQWLMWHGAERCPSPHCPRSRLPTSHALTGILAGVRHGLRAHALAAAAPAGRRVGHQGEAYRRRRGGGRAVRRCGLHRGLLSLLHCAFEHLSDVGGEMQAKRPPLSCGARQCCSVCSALV